MLESILTKKFREFLPQIYQKDPSFIGDDFLDKYLSVFESVISEMLPPESDVALPNEGVEQILARIHEFFSPWTAPGSAQGEASPQAPSDHELRDFLDWLAEWGGLLHKAALPEDERRRALARIIPLYKRRGTRSGLKEYLEIFTGRGTVQVLDTPDELLAFSQSHSLPNADFLLGNNFTFAVTVRLDGAAEEDRIALGLSQDEFLRLLMSVISREKPAHTDALLGIETFGGFIVGVIATIGEDTFLGRGPLAFESVNGVELG